MGKINLLTDEVANLIAAGEVVDRPASVLKELLENAIDAGATAITAEIRAGGVSLIRVTDNGCGIESEDLPLALERHATSKICNAADLDAICTLGFRGEALAAIAGVSVLEIVTRPAAAPTGTLMRAEYGKITEVSEIGCQGGTGVFVRDLFGNVPARRKFLKKDATESAAATALAERVALSHPEISFTLIVDGETRFRTAGDGDTLGVLYALEGRDFAAKLLPVSGRLGGMEISGFIGRSDNVRGNRNRQNMFINGRYIHSKTMMAALEQGFHSYIAPGKFPVSALFLTIPPGAVDVNVHPAKLEVRFSDERPVFEIVYHAVRGALEAAAYRPELETPAARRASGFTAPGGTVPRAIPISLEIPAEPAVPGRKDQSTEKPGRFEAGSSAPAYREPGGNGERGPKSPEKSIKKTPEPIRDGESSRPLDSRDSLDLLRRYAETKQAFRPAGVATVAAPGPALTYDIVPPEPTAPDAPILKTADVSAKPPLPAENPPAENPPAENHPAENLPAENLPAAPAPLGGAAGDSPDPAPQSPAYRLIGEAFRTYLLVEWEDKLLIIDKHAAHERILYEKLRAEETAAGRTASQGLLLPFPVNLTPEEEATVREGRADFEAVGFSFTLSGGQAMLEAVPSLLEPDDAGALFSEMAGSAAEGEDPLTHAMSRRERALYSVACKAAIKGGRKYDEAHLHWLIGEVLKDPTVTVCPHGRPIAVTMTRSYLDREFNRIQH